jgi:hypothetical protein
MTKNAFYIFVITLLLIINLVLVVFIFLKPPPPLNRKEPKHFIIERLKLDAGQIAKYEDLIADHRHQIREKDELIREYKHDLYGLLANDSIPRHVVDSITLAIAKIQKDIEVIHFEHFMDIKALCKPDQIKYFDETSTELQHIFQPDRPMGRPH